MCPICYYHEIAGLIQPKLSMFSTCNHWFQTPSPPVLGGMCGICWTEVNVSLDREKKSRQREQHTGLWLFQSSVLSFQSPSLPIRLREHFNLKFVMLILRDVNRKVFKWDSTFHQLQTVFSAACFCFVVSFTLYVRLWEAS